LYNVNGASTLGWIGATGPTGAALVSAGVYRTPIYVTRAVGYTGYTTFSFSTSSNTFVAVTGMSVTINTTYPNIICFANFINQTNPSTGDVLLGFGLDSALPLTQNITISFNGAMVLGTNFNTQTMIRNVSPGTHTIRLYMRTSSSVNAAIQGDSNRPANITAYEI